MHGTYCGTPFLNALLLRALLAKLTTLCVLCSPSLPPPSSEEAQASNLLAWAYNVSNYRQFFTLVVGDDAQQ